MNEQVEFTPEDIKYGLMVINPDQDPVDMDVLHFCGYANKPGEVEVAALREELLTDEEFGLTKHMDKLVILEAPEYIVEYFKGNILNEWRIDQGLEDDED